MKPTHDLSLTLDFGEVGYHDNREPFRVRLDAEALETLIADAGNAYRVYELTLIQRPGDVWDYVHVTPDAVPAALAQQIDESRAAAKIAYVSKHPWPEGKLPFADFDGLFQPAWAWDPTPLDEAWRSCCLDSYARGLFKIAKAALEHLDHNDPLIANELLLVRTGGHVLDELSRAEALKRLRDSFHSPKPARHAAGFYRELERLLGDPELVSVACRGDGDWTMLRLLCAEQRRRVVGTGHRPWHALFISMSSDGHPVVRWWGGEVLWFMEGLAHGDLLIEDRPNGARTKELIERYRRRPQVVLSDATDVQIDGYRRVDGDGWVRFERIEPTPRRLRMEIIAARRQPDHMPVVRFAESGGSVYAFEHGVVVLGESLSDQAMAGAAEMLAEWRKQGSVPWVLLCGNTERAVTLGIEGTAIVPEALGLASEAEQRDWLQGLLQRHRSWIDVAIALQAPPWISAQLGKILGRQCSPWAPWIVATAGAADLPADCMLGADPAEDLSIAIASARAAKPLKWLRP